MKYINSTNNPAIKHVVKLQNKRYRHEYKQFIAQGYNVCATLLEQKYELIELYTTEEEYKKHSVYLQPYNCTFITNDILQKISTITTPSGIVGVFAIPTPTYIPNSNAVVLHNIQDPGNMGTLIRTAAAMAVKNVFIIDGVDAYSPKVIQATAGTISYTTVISITWDDFFKNHKNIDLCALIVKNGSLAKNFDLKKSIIIVGNEGQGLPNNIVQSCTQKITLPMPGNTESLNAAVAGSIALYLKANQ